MTFRSKISQWILNILGLEVADGGQIDGESTDVRPRGYTGGEAGDQGQPTPDPSTPIHDSVEHRPGAPKRPRSRKPVQAVHGVHEGRRPDIQAPREPVPGEIQQ